MAQDKQVIVVTGGSRGIGRVVAVRLAGPGTVVCYNYHRSNDTVAEETGRLIEQAGGQAWADRVDVSANDDVKGFFSRIVDRHGRVDVLVNNAGVAIDGLLVRLKESDWDRVMSINLKGAFNCMQAVGKQMMKQRQGRIINMSSVVGVMGNAGQASYSASKAGLIGLTKTAARELAPRGITVNAIAPGFIDTAMTEELPDKAKQAMLSQIPLGRIGLPEDVAGVVAFLAAPEAGYITGQVIHVNGGMYM
mgnify:CR=1 FL=1